MITGGGVVFYVRGGLAVGFALEGQAAQEWSKKCSFKCSVVPILG